MERSPAEEGDRVTRLAILNWVVREGLSEEGMFELRFENRQAWQKRREGAEGARQWGNRRMIVKLGEALAHSVSHSA